MPLKKYFRSRMLEEKQLKISSLGRILAQNARLKISLTKTLTIFNEHGEQTPQQIEWYWKELYQALRTLKIDLSRSELE